MAVFNFLAWGFGGFVAVLVGLGISEYLKTREQKSHKTNLKTAYLSEFDIIREQFENAVPVIVRDFENPHNLSHHQPPEIDFVLIDTFTRELAIAGDSVSRNHRQVIGRLRNLGKDLRDISRKREDIEWPDGYTKQLGNEFKRYTAGILFKAIQVQYYLIKLDKEGDNFYIGDGLPYYECTQISCKECDVSYDAELWRKVDLFRRGIC